MSFASKFCNLLSDKSYSKLKIEDPLTVVKFIPMSQTPSSFPSLGYPKKFNPNYFHNIQGLICQLKDKILNVDLFQMLRENVDHGSSMTILVKTLINSQESATNASLIVFLVEFVPLLEPIWQLLFDKEHLAEELKERRELRQYHFDAYITVKLETLSFKFQSQEADGMMQSKADAAIEHHERVVTLEKLI